MREILKYGRGREGFISLKEAERPGSCPHAHTHDELELNLVVAGRARYKMPDGGYELGRGSIVWLFPGQPHVLVDFSAGFKMWILVFNRGCVRRRAIDDAAVLAKDDPGRSFCRTLPGHEIDTLCADFARLAALDGRNAFNAGLEFAMAVAWDAFKKAESIPSAALHPSVERALELLDKGSGIKMDELAKTSGLSASCLSRLFNSQLGVSIPKFRNQVRMRRFHELMRRPSPPSLTEAALMSGFGSYVQFNRVFRELYGRRPSAM